MKKSLFGAWLIVFIIATRELSAAIFLVGPNTRTMSVMLYDLSEEGNFEVLSALGGILLVITVALGTIGMKLLGPDFRTEEHTSELKSLMPISYALFCLKNTQTTSISHT